MNISENNGYKMRNVWMFIHDQSNNIIMMADDIVLPIIGFFQRILTDVSQLHLPYQQIVTGMSFAALILVVFKLSRINV